jgi:nitrogen fixation NifU-like protein
MPQALYQEIVLAHNRAPRRFGTLPAPTHAADGANARCGDHLRCELSAPAGRIDDVRFSGESCAVTTACASMLGDLLLGRTAADIAALEQRFRRVLDAACSDTDDDQALGELNALRALRAHPARHRCALLPFATVQAALAGIANASTEVAT